MKTTKNKYITRTLWHWNYTQSFYCALSVCAAKSHLQIIHFDVHFSSNALNMHYILTEWAGISRNRHFVFELMSLPDLTFFSSQPSSWPEVDYIEHWMKIPILGIRYRTYIPIWKKFETELLLWQCYRFSIDMAAVTSSVMLMSRNIDDRNQNSMVIV